MRTRFSDEFKRELKKIRNQDLRSRIWKQLIKLEYDPYAGKPLSGNLKGKRTIRITPFRLIYTIEGDRVIIENFDHRKIIYE